MEEKQKQAPAPPRNFQEEVADAIVNGNLVAFKKCCVGKNDINRRLLPNKELKPKPKYNPSERYINIKGPTMLMFAILCEQDEIVKFILETKNPDVSIKVEGYNCLHIAAMVKDHRCLQLLLQHAWIQENINEKIDLVGTKPDESEKTTALHAASSNRRYANAILLVDKLPKIVWSTKKDAKPKQQTTEPQAEGADDQTEEKKEDDDEDEDVENESAIVDQKSASGATPLYIAVYLRDHKMVKILLAAGALPNTECAKGKTPLQLATEIKNQNEERKEKLRAQQEQQAQQQPQAGIPKKRAKAQEPDEIDQIMDIFDRFEKGQTDSLEVLKEKYAPELLPQKEKDEDEEEEEEDADDEKEASESKEKEKAGSKPSRSKSEAKILNKILKQLELLNSRVAKLETEKRTFSAISPSSQGQDPNVTTMNPCAQCGALGAILCPQCHHYYCERCHAKPSIHKCVK